MQESIFQKFQGTQVVSGPTFQYYSKNAKRKLICMWAFFSRSCCNIGMLVLKLLGYLESFLKVWFLQDDLTMPLLPSYSTESFHIDDYLILFHIIASGLITRAPWSFCCCRQSVGYLEGPVVLKCFLHIYQTLP